MEFKVSLMSISKDRKEGTVNEGICLLSLMNIDLINFRIVFIFDSITESICCLGLTMFIVAPERKILSFFKATNSEAESRDYEKQS